MDNMLYIVVGLVVILLIVVLVLRKKKTDQLPTQTSVPTDKNLVTSASEAKKKATESNQSATKQNATSFDPLTVAQRFMDQQRYDKAVETIERALVEKPKDAQLSLKLLNIYAITNQYDGFDKTYNVIKSFDDVEAIEKANQLKALLEQEQTQNQPVENKAGEADSEAAFESLDFDLTTPQTATDTNPISNKDSSVSLDNLEIHSKSIAVQKEPSANDYHTDDNFDLTLDDLETSDVEINTLGASTSDVDIIEDSSFDENSDVTSTEPAITDDVSTTKNINVDDDFMLDFDLMSDDSSSSELDFVDDTQVQSSQSQDISSDDDFVLELDDLVAETESTNSLENSAQTDSEEFALLLENEDSLAVENSTFSMDTLDTQESASDNASVFDNDNVLENDVEDTLAQLDTIGVNDELSINDDMQSAVNEVPEVDTSTLMLDTEGSDTEVSSSEALNSESFDDKVLINDSFDDSTSIDDEFDFDPVVASPSVSMPVESESNVSIVDDENADGQNVETPTSQDIDFAAQFATDFDFVNTLDSNQVTLDLAGQYLQLGEYDSAKRLLNEVITQGNSEQQNQAQEMLARTA